MIRIGGGGRDPFHAQAFEGGWEGEGVFLGEEGGIARGDDVTVSYLEEILELKINMEL